jgi:hypothetical protein
MIPLRISTFTSSAAVITSTRALPVVSRYMPIVVSTTTSTLSSPKPLIGGGLFGSRSSSSRRITQQQQQQQQSSRYYFSDTSLAKTSKDGVVGYPIDFDVCSKIEGNESQIVTIQLKPGQVLRAESGAMMYMTKGVEMNTTTGGGLSEGFRRMMTGQNFFISDYTYQGEPGTTGTVALGTDFPSKIIRLNVEEYGGKLVCQKGALLYVYRDVIRKDIEWLKDGISHSTILLPLLSHPTKMLFSHHQH